MKGLTFEHWNMELTCFEHRAHTPHAHTPNTKLKLEFNIVVVAKCGRHSSISGPVLEEENEVVSGLGFAVPAVNSKATIYHTKSRRISSSTILTMRQSIVASFILLAGGASAFTPSTSSRQSVVSLSASVDDKTEVREYFNSEGFNRWNKIYSESDDVNSVQLDIRTGHDQTIDKILNWIKADGDIAGKSVCDCGCGVGSLSIPLAQMGKTRFSKSVFSFLVFHDSKPI